MRLQKMLGVLCLLLSVAIIMMSIIFNEDATMVCITIPLGLWMLFSKKNLISVNIDDEDDEEF
jgi:hypothetical protein